ncbi:MAG: hypothetical protein WA910_07815, partial [Sphingopyxis granuli]
MIAFEFPRGSAWKSVLLCLCRAKSKSIGAADGELVIISALITPDSIGNYSFSAGNCSPAKAGVHAKQRCTIWTPA